VPVSAAREQTPAIRFQSGRGNCSRFSRSFKIFARTLTAWPVNSFGASVERVNVADWIQPREPVLHSRPGRDTLRAAIAPRATAGPAPRPAMSSNVGSPGSQSAGSDRFSLHRAYRTHGRSAAAPKPRQLGCAGSRGREQQFARRRPDPTSRIRRENQGPIMACNCPVWETHESEVVFIPGAQPCESKKELNAPAFHRSAPIEVRQKSVFRRVARPAARVFFALYPNAGLWFPPLLLTGRRGHGFPSSIISSQTSPGRRNRFWKKLSNSRLLCAGPGRRFVHAVVFAINRRARSTRRRCAGFGPLVQRYAAQSARAPCLAKCRSR